MKLEKLIKKCADALQEEAGRDYTYMEDRSFGATVNTKDGHIDLGYTKGDVEVVVYHDYEGDPNHPRYGIFSENLEKFLSEALSHCVDWNVVEEDWRDNCADEYQRNGFASEADFWRWKEG